MQMLRRNDGSVVLDLSSTETKNLFHFLGDALEDPKIDGMEFDIRDLVGDLVNLLNHPSTNCSCFPFSNTESPKIRFTKTA